MELLLYEDQTGLMMFPEKREDKDNKIVSYFNNSVDLYIEKMGNSLKIYCHLIAYKASARPLGYYIIYKDSYDDNIFTNLKKESERVLQNLELQLRTGHTDNIIFENIDKFDNKYQQYGDVDLVLNAINFGKNLGYTAGNISEISAFCKDILRKSNNIKISISSKKNDLGNVNILINKKYAESLRKEEDTEYALNETRERLIEKDKIAKGEPGRNKVKEGFTTIKQGIGILKDAGYNLPEIQKVANDITFGEIFALQIKGAEIGRNEVDKRVDRNKRRERIGGIEKIKDEPVEERTGGFLPDIVFKIAAVLAIFVVVLSALAYTFPDYKNNIKAKISNMLPWGEKDNKVVTNQTVTPIPTPTIIITPIPSPSPSPNITETVTAPTPTISLPVDSSPTNTNTAIPGLTISGFVFMANSSEGLQNWVIYLYDKNKVGIAKNTTDSNGFYIFEVQKNETYIVTEGSKEGYGSVGPVSHNVEVKGESKMANFTNKRI